MKSKLILSTASILLACSPLCAGDEFRRIVTPFIAEHCASCHGAEKQKGKLRLDTLSADFSDPLVAEKWKEVVNAVTRVITFQWAREAGGLGTGGQNHHELSHHGGDPRMLKSLAAVDRGYLEKLSRFLTFLKTTEEGGRPMLDHTMVIYGSGMNSGPRGEHSLKNLPLLVTGGVAYGLKHGQHIANDPDKHPPLSNVLLTVAQKMGAETPSFADSTGEFVELI